MKRRKVSSEMASDPASRRISSKKFTEPDAPAPSPAEVQAAAAPNTVVDGSSLIPKRESARLREKKMREASTSQVPTDGSTFLGTSPHNSGQATQSNSADEALQKGNETKQNVSNLTPDPPPHSDAKTLQKLLLRSRSIKLNRDSVSHSIPQPPNPAPARTPRLPTLARDSPEEIACACFLASYDYPPMTKAALGEINKALIDFPRAVVAFLQSVNPKPPNLITRLNLDFQTVKQLRSVSLPLPRKDLISKLCCHEARLLFLNPPPGMKLHRAANTLIARAIHKAGKRKALRRSLRPSGTPDIIKLFAESPSKAFAAITSGVDGRPCTIDEETLHTYFSTTARGSKSAAQPICFDLSPLTDLPEIKKTRPPPCSDLENTGSPFSLNVPFPFPGYRHKQGRVPYRARQIKQRTLDAPLSSIVVSHFAIQIPVSKGI